MTRAFGQFTGAKVEEPAGGTAPQTDIYDADSHYCNELSRRGRYHEEFEPLPPEADALCDDLIAQFRAEFEGAHYFRRTVRRDNMRGVWRYSIYLGTVLCPKPDPLGRYALADMRVSAGTLSHKQALGPHENLSRLVLAGSPGVVLAQTYFHPSNERHVQGFTVWRHHGEPGTRLPGFGWGAYTYFGSSLAASILSPPTAEPVVGVYSVRGQRSDAAEGMWAGLRRKHWAIAHNDQTSVTTKIRVCAHATEEDVYNAVANAGLSTGPVSVWMRENAPDFPLNPRICLDDVEIKYLSGSQRTYDLLIPGMMTSDGRANVSLVFTPHGHLRLPCNILWSSKWEAGLNASFDEVAYNALRAASPRARRDELLSWIAGNTEAAEMLRDQHPVPSELLMRAWHGPSKLLAQIILERLAGESIEHARIYMNRPEIRPLVADTPLYQSMQGRQPPLPLGGVNDYPAFPPLSDESKAYLQQLPTE